MRIKQWMLSAVVLLISVSMIPLASAQERQGYAGIGIGNSDLDKGGYGDDTGFKIYGGYQFNKWLAIEGAFVDLGDFTSSTQPMISIDGFQATALGVVPLGDAFRVFGKAGLFKNGGTDLTYGLGFEWGRKIGVRAEWERYTDVNGGSDVDMISVSAIFNFGAGAGQQ